MLRKNRRISALLAGLLAVMPVAVAFAAWDKTKPATNGALVSADIRANWTAIEAAIGNPDTTPLTIKQADIAASSRLGGALTFKPGGDSAYDATISGRVYSDFADHANTSTTETTLATYTLPAAVLNADGKALRIVGWGSLANNADNKQVRVYFGATVVVDSALVTTGNADWVFEVTVMRSGATTQRSGGTMITSVLTSPTGSPKGQTAAPAETLSGTVTIKVTGQSGTGSNDVTQKGFMVEVVG